MTTNNRNAYCRALASALALALVLWGLAPPAWADVLLGTNGDRFTGKVVAENPASVVFDSDLGGKLITRIRHQ